MYTTYSIEFALGHICMQNFEILRGFIPFHGIVPPQLRPHDFIDSPLDDPQFWVYRCVEVHTSFIHDMSIYFVSILQYEFCVTHFFIDSPQRTLSRRLKIPNFNTAVSSRLVQYSLQTTRLQLYYTYHTIHQYITTTQFSSRKVLLALYYLDGLLVEFAFQKNSVNQKGPVCRSLQVTRSSMENGFQLYQGSTAI